MHSWQTLNEGRELDKAVATAAGWQLMQWPPLYAPPDPKFAPGAIKTVWCIAPPNAGNGYKMKVWDTPDEAWATLPCFSTALADAEILFTYSPPHDQRFLYFWADQERGSSQTGLNEAIAMIQLALATNKKALAICYAFLCWNELEKSPQIPHK